VCVCVYPRSVRIQVIAAADDIITCIDQPKLALHFAMKTEPEATSYLVQYTQATAHLEHCTPARPTFHHTPANPRFVSSSLVRSAPVLCPLTLPQLLVLLLPLHVAAAWCTTQKERKEREAERDALVDALFRKGLALATAEEVTKKKGEGQGEGEGKTKGEGEGARVRSKGEGEGTKQGRGGGGGGREGRRWGGQRAFWRSLPGSRALQHSQPAARVPPPKGASPPQGRPPAVPVAVAVAVALPVPVPPLGSGAAEGVPGGQQSGQCTGRAVNHCLGLLQGQRVGLMRFEANFAEFKKWGDPGSAKHGMLLVRCGRGGRGGTALRSRYSTCPYYMLYPACVSTFMYFLAYY